MSAVCSFNWVSRLSDNTTCRPSDKVNKAPAFPGFITPVTGNWLSCSILSPIWNKKASATPITNAPMAATAVQCFPIRNRSVFRFPATKRRYPSPTWNWWCSLLASSKNPGRTNSWYIRLCSSSSASHCSNCFRSSPVRTPTIDFCIKSAIWKG